MHRTNLNLVKFAIKKAEELERRFDQVQEDLRNYEKMRDYCKNELGFNISDTEYEEVKEGIDKGDYVKANKLIDQRHLELQASVADYREAEKLIDNYDDWIESARQHILVEQFVKEQEASEQNFKDKNLKESIQISVNGINKIEQALHSWIPKISINLPDGLVATESNRATILIENIGKTKITAIEMSIEGLDVTGRLSTGEIEPGKSAEVIVALIPSTPGNIPVTITSNVTRSYDSTVTATDEEIWIEVARPGSTPKTSAETAKIAKGAEKEQKINAEWTVPPSLSKDEEIVGNFFTKRWESYRSYPNNQVTLDHLHNNREKYAISSYFEVATEPKKVMDDWALPNNLRGNIHLDDKRAEIVRDIFESQYDKNYVIIGEPGVGKTVLLFEIFDRLMKREPVGVLTNENIGNAHEKFRIRLFYDDISEKPDLYKAIASKEEISGLILSSREAEWSELPVDFRKKFTRLTVPRFSDQEMESLILKTLDVNVILHDSKALKLLVKYAQGSPIYVGSLIKEMIYNGIRRLSETYLKENAQKGMEGYVIMILQRLLKSGNDYRSGGLHTLSCLMFLANHVEERKCHEQLLRAFANEIDIHMEAKFDDIYDRRTFNRSIDYLSGEGSLVRFPHDTWVDILQGQGASNPFRPDIQEIRKEFEDSGMFEKLKKDSIDDSWETILKRYHRNNVREKDSFLELCNTLTSNFRLSDLKEMGVDIEMVREISSKHRDEPIAASILSRLESAQPNHNVINIQDSVINRSNIGLKDNSKIEGMLK